LFLFLERKEVTVNQVAELVGISQSTASEQLTVLKKARLLSPRKEGKEVFLFHKQKQDHGIIARSK
jgi:ArsR family transcriptional regulator, arsenate/arsenite/antimonite-responsive transcriptional repressor